MRGKSISTDETTGTTRWQPDDEPQSYHRMLGVVRNQYERRDDPKPRIVKSVEPMATVSWADARTTADKLNDASDLAIFLELNRTGYAIAANVLKQE
jgi:hypothetical protein